MLRNDLFLSSVFTMREEAFKHQEKVYGTHSNDI